MSSHLRKLQKQPLNLLIDLFGALAMKTKSRDKKDQDDSRITRTRSDGTRFVELKAAVERQKEQGRFEEMKKLRLSSG